MKILIMSVNCSSPFQIDWQEGEQEWLLSNGIVGEAEQDELGNINVYAEFNKENEILASEYCLRFNRREAGSYDHKVHWADISCGRDGTVMRVDDESE